MRTFFFLLFSIIFLTCNTLKDDQKNGSKSYEDLMNGTRSIVVGGKELKSEVYIWRDLMPSIDPGNTGILFSVKLTSADGSDLPAGLKHGKVWIFNKDRTWELTPAVTEASDSKMMELYGRNGPSWEPKTIVNVALELGIDNNYKLFLIEGQEVQAVY